MKKNFFRSGRKAVSDDDRYTCTLTGARAGCQRNVYVGGEQEEQQHQASIKPRDDRRGSNEPSTSTAMDHRSMLKEPRIHVIHPPLLTSRVKACRTASGRLASEEDGPETSAISTALRARDTGTQRCEKHGRVRLSRRVDSCETERQAWRARLAASRPVPGYVVRRCRASGTCFFTAAKLWCQFRAEPVCFSFCRL